jgi:hypothetical protein
VSRDIRLHYERVVAVALGLAVLLPLFFLLTSYSVAGPSGAAHPCGPTVLALGGDRATTADPNGACHAGAVERLHLAGGYFVAGAVVALAVWLLAGARERSLNRAWASARVPSRWFSTPGQVWFFAALLFVVFAPALQRTV